MAEGFEPYHVPQQSRRDKLRVLAQNQPGLVEGCAGLLPLYDPSLMSSHLLTCANQAGPHFHNQTTPLSSSSSSSSVSVSQHHAYLDPASSLSNSMNPGTNTIQVIGNNPFLYPPQNLQNLREFGQSYNGSEIMVFKPETLSLSLSSHDIHQPNLPLELNLQRYGSVIYGDKVGDDGGCVVPGLVGGGGSASDEVSRNTVSMGPFTGYASILKGSRFLNPAQQLLDELCDIGGRGIHAEMIAPDASLMASPSESLSQSGVADNILVSGDGGEERKKSRLLTMLDEICGRYRLYYQQMQAVVTSFEYVSGLGNAAPYASLAVKTMSKHFRCLKNAITDQLQFNNKAQIQLSNRKLDESPRFANNDRAPCSQRPLHNSGFLEHQPVWRHQRGLPERAVTVLRAWLFEHFLHPYPTDTDKMMLAKQTGLSRSQVSNWFINARVRLWKPMVEEIHTLETRQSQKSSQREDQNRNISSNDHLPSKINTVLSENPSISTDKFHDAPYKRTRNDQLPDMAVRSHEQPSLPPPYTSKKPVDVGVSSMGNASNGVSLTLGLHQNHGIELSEPFPMNAAQRYGLALEPNNEGFVMGGFESQSRHFGGQLLHDFVG